MEETIWNTLLSTLTPVITCLCIAVGAFISLKILVITEREKNKEHHKIIKYDLEKLGSDILKYRTFHEIEIKTFEKEINQKQLSFENEMQLKFEHLKELLTRELNIGDQKFTELNEKLGVLVDLKNFIEVHKKEHEYLDKIIKNNQ